MVKLKTNKEVALYVCRMITPYQEDEIGSRKLKNA